MNFKLKSPQTPLDDSERLFFFLSLSPLADCKARPPHDLHALVFLHKTIVKKKKKRVKQNVTIEHT